ncbi:hypothetical protein ACLOJK_011903 [Asimina triloba]
MHAWDAPSSHTWHAHIVSSLKAAGSSLRRITGRSRKNKGRGRGMARWSTETPNSVFSEEEETEGPSVGMDDSKLRRKKWSRKKKRSSVLLEGYVAGDDGEEVRQGVQRTKSLTDEDLNELKGCLDLGFGFNYEEIPELCGTLPALELCYSMSQRFLDEQQQQRSPEAASVSSEETCGATSTPIANWKISSPANDAFGPYGRASGEDDDIIIWWGLMVEGVSRGVSSLLLHLMVFTIAAGKWPGTGLEMKEMNDGREAQPQTHYRGDVDQTDGQMLTQSSVDNKKDDAHSNRGDRSSKDKELWREIRSWSGRWARGRRRRQTREAGDGGDEREGDGDKREESLT